MAIHFLFSLVCFAGLANESVVSYGEMGVYKHFFPSLAAVSDTAELYVLLKNEKVVKHFDANGNQLSDISGPGLGPGYLANPQKISYLDEKLYVFDANRVLTFTGSGEFLSQRSKPHGILFFSRVQNGWVGLRGLYPNQLNKAVELVSFHASDDGQVVYEWEPEQVRYPREPENPSIIVFNPAEEFTMLSVSPDGSLAAVSLSGAPDVFLFRIKDWTLVKKIEIKDSPIPFDLDHGDQLFKIFKDRFSKMQGVRIKASYPKYYPLIDSANFSLNNHLLVNKSLSPKLKQDNAQHFSAFNGNGKFIKPDILDFHCDRLVGMSKTRVWVTVFLSEESGYSVVSIPKSEMVSFIKDNAMPEITYDSF